MLSRFRTEDDTNEEGLGLKVSVAIARTILHEATADNESFEVDDMRFGGKQALTKSKVASH